MIVRYPIRCLHCKAKIRLRIGIGYSPHQPFYFSCKKCGTKIEGAITINGPDKGKIELKNAIHTKEDFFESPDFVVTVCEDFLTKIIDGNDERFYSPFIDTMMKMGESNYYMFGHDISTFKDNQETLKDWIFRINNFFIMNRIPELLVEGKVNGIEFCSNENYYSRLIVLNFDYLAPILRREYIQDSQKYFDRKIDAIVETKPHQLDRFIDYLKTNNYFTERLKENLSLIERFDKNFRLIKPIITLNYMEEQNSERVGFSIVGFEELKHIYLDMFESVGRDVDIIIGLRNIEANNDFNKLNNPSFEKIVDFESIMRSSNGNKKKFLENDIELFNLFRNDFDPHLRNGIGHFKCRYDAEKQMIEYYPDKHSRQCEKISYPEFVSKTYRLFNLMIILMQLRRRLMRIEKL